MDDAVTRIITGAFYQSGQSCISVQRILAHESVYDSFKEKFVAATSQLVMGDPREEHTFIGPMIAESEASRLQGWVDEAVNDGARILTGGTRRGQMFQATVLEGAARESKVRCREAFGPVVLLDKFTRFEEALDQVNDSVFGLQAGIFTRDLYKAHQAWDRLEVGGVVIGDVPSWRVDNMPYGGVKESGLGREGIRYAMEDMSEIRLLVIRNPAG